MIKQCILLILLLVLLAHAIQAKDDIKDASNKDAGNKDASNKDAGKKDAGNKDAGKKDAGNKDAGNKDAGKKDAGNKDTGKKGGVKRIKMEASGLEVESDDTVGEDMFSIRKKKDGDGENRLKFGFAKIIEVDSTGAFMDVTKHYCDFRKAKINCTKSDQTNGTFTGLDEDGNITSVPYTMVTKTCSLASCNNNANAALKIKSYIMKKKAYICTPECKGDSEEDEYQSPVFDGTAKWELEITDWDFCVSGTCNGKTAEKIKIFFSMGGKNSGKDMKPKKKVRKPFDMSKRPKYIQATKIKCMMRNGTRADPTDGSNKDSSNKDSSNKDSSNKVSENKDSSNKDSSNKDSKNKDSSNKVSRSVNTVSEDKVSDNKDSDNKVSDNKDSENKDSGNKDSDNKDSDNKDSGNKNGAGVIKGSTLKGKGICRLAKSRFGDKPDDQDSFSLEDDDGKNSSAMFRMFPAAITDDKLVDEESGFEGPNVEVETEGNTKRRYVTVAITKFEKKMIYDPTADVSEEGGTGDDNTSSASTINPALAYITILLAYLLQ